MTERRGDTLLFHTPPVIAAQAAVGGKKESEGPLARRWRWARRCAAAGRRRTCWP